MSFHLPAFFVWFFVSHDIATLRHLYVATLPPAKSDPKQEKMQQIKV